MGNIPITTGTGQASVASDLISTINYQQIKVVDGTIGSTTPLKVNADGSITASIYGNISVTPSANQSVSGTVGASIIGTVPVTGTLNSSFTQPSSLVSGVTSVITGIASVQVLVPAPTGQRNYITNVLVTNAAVVGTTVQLFDAGNVIYAGYAAASGGGFALAFPIALKQSSIAGNLSALSTVQASVFVSASGYTAA